MAPVLLYPMMDAWYVSDSIAISVLISKMEPGKQMQFFWSQIPLVLRKLPEGDMFRNALIARLSHRWGSL